MNKIVEIDHYSHDIHCYLYQKYFVNKQFILVTQTLSNQNRRLRVITIENGMIQIYSTELIQNEKNECIDVRILLLHQMCLINAICIQSNKLDFMIKTISGNIIFRLLFEEHISLLLNSLQLSSVFINSNDNQINQINLNYKKIEE